MGEAVAMDGDFDIRHLCHACLVVAMMGKLPAHL
jgi:hypothetical protein